MNKLQKIISKTLDIITLADSYFQQSKDSFKVIIRDIESKKEIKRYACFYQEGLFINTTVKTIKSSNQIFHAETMQEFFIDRININPVRITMNDAHNYSITGTLVFLRIGKKPIITFL